MDHVLTEHGLRLTYLRDPEAIEALDQERILDELFEGTPQSELALWNTINALPTYDHLVLASDIATGRTLGLLGGQTGETPQETFLLLETGLVIVPARGQNLLRRMIALALLRIAGLGPLPDAVVTLTCNPVSCHVLRAMSGAMRGARFAPELDVPVVRLDGAALLRRISASLGHRLQYGAAYDTLRAVSPASASRLRRLSYDMRMEQVFAPPRLAALPMLAALDLRGADEGPLLADTRRLYRARAGRTPIFALPAVERDPFWPAARKSEQAAGGPFGP